MAHSFCKRAFTLVELAIVLVIIGLITGGVLYGRELISQGVNTKQIRMLTELETATNTFRLRYGGLPGDLRNATTHFSSYPYGTVVNGNGNGRLMPNLGGGETSTGHDYYGVNVTMEIVQYYVHLVAAGLIPDLRPDGDSNILAGKDCPVNPAGTMPLSCALLYYFSANSFNPAGPEAGHWLSLSFYADNTPLGTAFLNSGAVNFMSKNAFFVDSKVDDGLPYNGRWLCSASAGGNVGSRPPLGSWGYQSYCVSGANPVRYRNVQLDGFTYPYGNQDPGNCYCFYRLFD